MIQFACLVLVLFLCIFCYSISIDVSLPDFSPIAIIVGIVIVGIVVVIWGGILLRLLLPLLPFFKKLGDWLRKFWKLITRPISFTKRQLQKKFKHAKDFGIEGNYNTANAEKFRQAIEAHVRSEGTKIIKGTYHGKDVLHYFDPKTGLNVIADLEGRFISGWKLPAERAAILLKTGSL